jgi:very-short-patch-repair endonuclease
LILADDGQHHPPAPSSKEEGEKEAQPKAPSSSEEGVGGGGERSELLKRAAEMRKNPTEPENRMWNQLRMQRFAGYKFRRQAVIGRRIVDFFCPAKGLVIEIDGDTHDFETDQLRDQRIEAEYGFSTVRFTNEDVMRNMEGVHIRLAEVLESTGDRWRARHHPPAPSSEEEGEL